MDETGFGQSQRTKKVVAVYGSKNVCSKTVEANCHVTITACVSTSGYVIPPAVPCPGETLESGCDGYCFGSLRERSDSIAKGVHE